jgi:hypothetical protein
MRAAALALSCALFACASGSDADIVWSKQGADTQALLRDHRDCRARSAGVADAKGQSKAFRGCMSERGWHGE